MSSGKAFEQVLQDVAMEIVGGRLPADARLTLSDIERDFGVSRTLARDVVKALASVGLLTSKRRAGIRVLPKNEWSVLDSQVIAWRLASDERLAQIASLTELRRGIEPMAARLAAARRCPDEAAELVGLAERLKVLGGQGLGCSEDYLQVDIAFHSLLLELSGNELFAAMQGMVADVLRGRLTHGLMPVWPDPRALEDHLHIARAVAEGDALLADIVSRRQMDALQTELVPQQAEGRGGW